MFSSVRRRTATVMDNDNGVDLALIRSEALYCLRREQLVSLCKRRGIKPKGKVRVGGVR